MSSSTKRVGSIHCFSSIKVVIHQGGRVEGHWGMLCSPKDWIGLWECKGFVNHQQGKWVDWNSNKPSRTDSSSGKSAPGMCPTLSNFFRLVMSTYRKVFEKSKGPINNWTWKNKPPLFWRQWVRLISTAFQHCLAPEFSEWLLFVHFFWSGRVFELWWQWKLPTDVN